MARRKVNLQGRDIWGEEIEFETEGEKFNTYILHDGTRLKIKTVVTEVMRLEAHKPDGDPLYLVNSTNIVSAVVPDSLKQKAD